MDLKGFMAAAFGPAPAPKKLTVDEVLKNFQKAVTDLEAVAIDMQMEAEVQNALMQEALDAHKAAVAESNRALKVKANLEKLLGA